MKILVVLETVQGRLRPAALFALGCAREIAEHRNATIEALLLGHQLEALASDAARYATILCADHESLAHPLADRLAPVIAGVAQQRNAELVIAASSSWAKDVIGRAGGLLGGAMASDVTAHRWVDNQLQFVRALFAGEVSAKVVLHGNPKVITVRSSAYNAASPLDTPASVTPVDTTAFNIPLSSEFVELRARNDSRPDATEAPIVVSGGRAFKNADDYEKLVGALADKLDAATGSSRALVDKGITPNELQIGQTGKVVAPELYLALGLSGAIQHLAGMNHSKVVASINKDPEAPIFSVTDYGLVGDVYEIIPELLEKL